jgi:hypothetical protein
MDTRQQAIEDLGRKIDAFVRFVNILHKEYYGYLERPDPQVQTLCEEDHEIVCARPNQEPAINDYVS